MLPIKLSNQSKLILINRDMIIVFYFKRETFLLYNEIKNYERNR